MFFVWLLRITAERNCCIVCKKKTSGIHGGYRLVSTYDLPDSKLTGGGRGYSLPSQNSKCQDLPKFQFSGGGVGVTLCQVKTQSAKICLNFNFRGRGYSLPSQNSKCQDLPKFQFSRGGGRALFREWGHSRNFEPNFTVQPETCLCITDSLPHMWRLMKAQATRRSPHEFHLHESAQSTVSCRCDTNSDRNLDHFA